MPSILDQIHAWRLCSAIELIFNLARWLVNIPWIAWKQERRTLVDGDLENGDGMVERSAINTLETARVDGGATAASSMTLLEHLRYNPSVEQLLSSGSTSLVGRLKSGVVLKSPRFSWWKSTEVHDVVKEIRHSFSVEEEILGILGPHPNLAKFLGPSENPRGLLFAEANRGNLQTYLDTYNDKIDIATRIRWRTQAAGVTWFIHQKNVIHSDQRPENYLVHGDDNGTLNIYLTDFGGSTCWHIDGGHLPDAGFFNPRSAWVSTVYTDIFSLGSVFYTIMTGHWPYKSPGPFESVEEKYEYEEMVDALFSEAKFPIVENLVGGAIIQRCWTEEYKDAESLLHDQELLEQEYPRDSLFRDDLFDTTCKKIRNRNEAMVVRDILPLIVPSAQTLATCGATHLNHLIESVNEGWNSARSFYGPRPQPDYSLGFGRSAFTDNQLEKLKPFIGEVPDNFTSLFMATWQMYFPFLTCEVKCGNLALDLADRQNAHSMTLAVRGIVELFRMVRREKELHLQILAFSVSHDHRTVRIYGHYPSINGDKTEFYRHSIHDISFALGKEKWAAYTFTTNVYDIWMPTHLERIRSAIDALSPNLEQSEPGGSGLSQGLERHSLADQSSNDAASILEDAGSSHVDSPDVTLDTSLSQGAFKKPRKRGRNMESY